MIRVPACLLLVACAGLVPAQQPNPVLQRVPETAGLPRLLLIGDSISIGYTPPVREALRGRMNVQRIPENAAHTRFGAGKVDQWIGSEKWDVIHFNFGLHDLKIMEDGKHQVPVEEYERHLEAIAKRLQQTGARVIYATTTPVPEGKVSPPRNPADVPLYNQAAKRVMDRLGIPVNDLYAAVLPKLSELQRPVNVHFVDAGSAFLATRVVAEITRIAPHTAFRWVNPLPANAPAGVLHETYPSKLHQTAVGYAVYLPPGYADAANASHRYPVVYYLHGGRPGGENKSVAMARFFDQHMRAGTVDPMIYVFVNGGAVSHYDYPQLKSFGESAFIKELIPHIDSRFRTIASKQGRGLEGFSQGGRGTARIAFRHPDLFCSAAPMGGGHQHERRASENNGQEAGPEGYVFEPGLNTWDLASTYARQGTARVRWLVVVGDQDFNYQANLDWMKHLDSLAIRHQRIIVPRVPHSAAGVYEKIGPAGMKFHQACFAGAPAARP
jgi:endo-1,4-beta-xylanase